MRLSAGCRALNHGNRLGYLGYGMKPRKDIVGPADARAFRNIKLSEIPAWLNGRPKDLVYIYMSIRRYWIAWLYKYSRPGMQPMAHKVGQYGFTAGMIPSGSLLAQAIIGLVLAMQLVVCYKENVHHRFKKYHSYPVSETLMACLPFNYKSEDVGGEVALKGFAFDALVAGSLLNCATAGKYAPSAAMAARRAQAGYVGLGVAALITLYNRVTFKSKSVALVDETERAQLALLLGCDSADLDDLVKKNEEMKNPLRYSILTNLVVRLYDAVLGLAP